MPRTTSAFTFSRRLFSAFLPCSFLSVIASGLVPHATGGRYGHALCSGESQHRVAGGTEPVWLQLRNSSQMLIYASRFSNLSDSAFHQEPLYMDKVFVFS